VKSEPRVSYSGHAGFQEIHKWRSILCVSNTSLGELGQ
jgi:hypothetical protein